MTEPASTHPVRVKYLFHLAARVADVHRFYVELLGMKVVSYRDDPVFPWLSVDAGGFEMMWFKADRPAPASREFSSQPGWEGGTREATSWAVQVAEEDFAATWRRLRDAGVPLFRPVPEWRQDSYWGLSALDPTGATVEVYATPRVRPASTVWEGA